MVGGVALASGSFVAYHDLCLTAACGGEVNGLGQHLQHVLPGGLIPTIESEWLGCCQMGMWMPWSSCLYPAFSDGFSDYSLAFPYG